MKQQRNTTGLVGYVNGIRLVQIPQVYEPGTRNALIDNTKLIFMPVRADFKPIKVVNEGDAYMNEVTDRETNVDMTIEAEYIAEGRRCRCNEPELRYLHRDCIISI